MAIATAASGDIYVADAGNYRIQRFDPDGAFKGQLSSSDDVEPVAIAVAVSGDVYVLRRKRMLFQIDRFEPSGNFR